MKPIRPTFTAILILLLSLPVMAQKRLFSDLPKRDDITTVFISPAAMKLGLNFANDGNDSEMAMIKKGLRNPQGMEIVSAESVAAKKILAEKIQKVLSTLKLDLLLETNEGDEITYIYTSGTTGDTTLQDIIIINEEPDEYNVIYIRGEIDMSIITKDRR